MKHLEHYNLKRVKLTEEQKTKVDEHNREVTHRIEAGEYKPFNERKIVMVRTTKSKTKSKKRQLKKLSVAWTVVVALNVSSVFRLVKLAQLIMT